MKLEILFQDSDFSSYAANFSGDFEENGDCFTGLVS